MKIYNVYQSGKRLYIDEKENPDNKIVVNKYDNMQQTLRLVSDGTLPPRLYWALRNPKLSNKYFILKLVNNEDLIVGTDISATPGLWDMLLIGTDDDYIIEGTDIDQSRLTYVSDHFGRLFVRDNFLEELDFEEQTSPTFKIFYDEIMFQLGNKADSADIPDKLSDLENDTNFISGVAFKDDGQGNVEIIGTTFSGGETEEGEIPSGGNIEVDDKLDEESTNPVQNKVIAKEVKSLKEKDESIDKEVIALRERNADLEETIEKLQIKQTTDKAPFHHITDSANMKVVDFGMEGKTEQFTGTITDEEGNVVVDDEGNNVIVPNPDFPQEIVNAGVYNEETGRYENVLRINKKNFFDINAYREEVDGITVSDGVINITKSGKRLYYDLYLPAGTYNAKATVENYCVFSMACSDGTTVINSSVANNELNSKFTIKEGQNVIFSLYGGGFDATDISLHRKIYDIRIGLYSENEYEEFKGKSLTLTSPVPLTKWDYLIKRDGIWGWSVNSRIHAFTGNEGYGLGGDAYYTGESTACIIYLPNKKSVINDGIQYDYINKLSFVPSIWTKMDGSIGYYSMSNYVIMRFRNADMEITDNMSRDEKITCFKSYLKSLYENGNPVIIAYETDTEQSFHPLPDEEQTLLNNLETYYGVTNLYNDQGCPMWLCYTCDSKLYVDQKLEQINNALLSLGANV